MGWARELNEPDKKKKHEFLFQISRNLSFEKKNLSGIPKKKYPFWKNLQDCAKWADNYVLNEEGPPLSM